MPRPRLKKGDISFQEIYELSRLYYKTQDDKKQRMKLDVISATIKARKNYTYNRSTRQWEQTGREILFTFLVRTSPVSYKKTDSIKIHKYPIYFLFRDISMGMNSAFRWREGNMYSRPSFARKGMTAKQRQTIADLNIRKGIQMNFFFNVMQLADFYGLLYGPNYTNKHFPTKANPELWIYFGKHALACINKILIPILTREEGKQALKSRGLI